LHSTLKSVLAENLKLSERTTFWNDEERRNVDPLAKPDTNFFKLDWDVKVQSKGISLCHKSFTAFIPS
jgi:hypothetical protein